MAFPKPVPKEPGAVDATLAPFLDHIADELAQRVARRLMLDAPNLTPTIPEVLTTAEAAKLIRVHPNTLALAAKQGRVPGRKLGDRWMFRRSTLLKWLDGEYVLKSETPCGVEAE